MRKKSVFKIVAALVVLVLSVAARYYVSGSSDLSFLRVPLIGEDAPAFEDETTEGKIKFPDDYEGKWVILFFTPACTTE